ncbi:MAG: hypothetical protein KGN84_07430 [Acidobacteriota bacterium]|nr:hypothetical protein [Acidobacteriota bacterium]
MRVRTVRGSLFFLCVAVGGLAQDAPLNELAFGLGGIPSISRGASPSVQLGAGPALQVNYGRRLFSADLVAIYGEINFVANPLRDVATTAGSATRNVASLYVTPGIRVKLLPKSRFSPYFAIGGGYADFEQSRTQINGSPNTAPRQLGRGAFDAGGGIDVRTWRWIALRGEIRDFYSGAPAYNIATIRGGQNDIMATGAFVLRWH